MGKVIELFDDYPKCVVCELEADRLVFDVNVCHLHAVPVASFMLDINRHLSVLPRASIIGLMSHVASSGLSSGERRENES
jgi:uncharacterized tellurite resistance protein B-like protein